jgi:hypothetical protein
VLDHLIDDLPAVLLDSAGRADLRSAAGLLPLVLSRRSVGLELRLQGPRCGDLFVAAVPTQPDGRILLEALLDSPLSGAPAVTRLASALSRWRQGSGWLARCCRFVLLELDASRRVGGVVPPPSIYLAPRGADDANAGLDHSANTFHRDPEGLIAALAELSGGKPDPAVVADVRRMLDLLPAHAEVFAAGAMLSRPTPSAPRLAVRRLRAGELVLILNGLNRRRAAAALVPVATDLRSVSTNLCLALDLGPQASDAVGVEIYTGSYWSAGNPAGWEALLGELVRLGLADEDRADAAAHLARPGTEDSPTVGLSHVKVTAVGDDLAPTKIYLGYEGAHRVRPQTGVLT